MNSETRSNSTCAIPARTGPVARPETGSEPSGREETFEVRGRYGNLLATAETLDLAKRDVRYRIANLGQTGLTVQRVTTLREVVYRPRLVTVLPS